MSSQSFPARCGLAAAAVFEHQSCLQAVRSGAGWSPQRRLSIKLLSTGQPVPLGNTFCKHLLFQAAAGCSPHRLQAASFCSKTTAGCQCTAHGLQLCCSSALLGSSFGAQRPLRGLLGSSFELGYQSALRCSKAAAGCQPALPGRLWCSKAAAGSLGSSFGAQRLLGACSPVAERPLRAATRRFKAAVGAQRPLRAASLLKGRCGLPPHHSALLGSSFGAQRLLRAASPHRLQAASPHRLEAALLLKDR